MPDLPIAIDWPIWLIATVIILKFLPDALKGLSFVIPPLGVWMERKAEVEALRINADTWDRQSDADFAKRMLGVIETSMNRNADAATRTMDAIISLNASVVQLQHAVDRQANIVTGLNQTIAVLADNVSNLSERINSLKWLLVNKANGDPITIMASLEEEEKLLRRRGQND